MILPCVSLSLLALAMLAPAAEPSELLPPVQLQSAGQPLDVQRSGFAAPFVGDVDGDGIRDLLVGQSTKAGCASTATRAATANPKSPARY